MGEAARIFTGAPIPDGADTVIRQEWCQVEGDILSLHRLPHKGDCIRYAGEDIKQKQFVLKKGTYLNAQHLGLLAVIGKKSFKVFRRLKVALLVTGSELVDPGEKLSPGKIYNSNQYVLKALLAHFGCSIIESKIVPDDFSATRSELKAAAEKVDFILTSGGVSVGEEDHVKPVIQAEGKIHFWRIAVKPGKPVVYGAINSSQKIGAIPIIGLPGNPVSAFVTFLLFVRPYLLKMQGVETGLPRGFWVKSADTYLSSEDRREFLRAKLNQTEILQELVFASDRLEIVHAPDVVTNDDVPTTAIRTKKTSSIVVAYDYLKTNEDAVALVSAGSTGATLTGAVLKLGRIPNISRPALAPLLPTINDNKVMLVDCGANADCKPENLLDFAIMGDIYMRAQGVKTPRIGLLNIGTEEEKGDELHKQAHQLLKKAKLNFVGNIEARDVLRGNVDVVVCDGFSGNICLKSMEGIAEMLFAEIKDTVKSSFKAKIGAMFLKSSLKGIKNKYDYTKCGGAPLLGVNKIVLKCHGNSKAPIVADTINQAYELAKNQLIEKVKKAVEKDEK